MHAFHQPIAAYKERRGPESQSRACVSFSLAVLVSPPSKTSYLILYCLMSVLSRVGSASCCGFLFLMPQIRYTGTLPNLRNCYEITLPL